MLPHDRKTRWHPLGPLPSPLSNTAEVLAGDPIWLIRTASGLFGVDPSDGRVRWELRWTLDRELDCGSCVGSDIVAVAIASAYDKWHLDVHAYETTTGAARWHATADSPFAAESVHIVEPWVIVAARRVDSEGTADTLQLTWFSETSGDVVHVEDVPGDRLLAHEDQLYLWGSDGLYRRAADPIDGTPTTVSERPHTSARSERHNLLTVSWDHDPYWESKGLPRPPTTPTQRVDEYTHGNLEPRASVPLAGTPFEEKKSAIPSSRPHETLLSWWDVALLDLEAGEFTWTKSLGTLSHYHVVRDGWYVRLDGVWHHLSHDGSTTTPPLPENSVLTLDDEHLVAVTEEGAALMFATRPRDVAFETTWPVHGLGGSPPTRGVRSPEVLRGIVSRFLDDGDADALRSALLDHFGIESVPGEVVDYLRMLGDDGPPSGAFDLHAATGVVDGIASTAAVFDVGTSEDVAASIPMGYDGRRTTFWLSLATGVVISLTDEDLRRASQWVWEAGMSVDAFLGGLEDVGYVLHLERLLAVHDGLADDWAPSGPLERYLETLEGAMGIDRSALEELFTYDGAAFLVEAHPEAAQRYDYRRIPR